MDKHLLRFFGLICIWTFIIPTASAQHLANDGPASADSSSYVRQIFESNLSQQSGLYNGLEYQFYNPEIEGSAYFNEAKFFDKGSLVYNGVRYDNVPLMYDLHADRVVSLLYDGYNKFQLIDERVREFDLYNHHFVRIAVDSADRSTPIRTGYYDEIYAGKITLLAKRTRELKETSGARELKRYFLAKNTYFLKKEGQYISVNSDRSFFNALGDRRKDLQRFLKDNKVNYRKNPEHAMVMLATYYDRPSN
jgi:hypothetical protein